MYHHFRPQTRLNDRCPKLTLAQHADRATARENQDTACLSFALSWLLYLRQAHPNDDSDSFANLANIVGGGNSDSSKDEIAFLKSKARETKHWSLMSSTLLEEAKMEMYSVSFIVCADTLLAPG